MSWRQRHHTFRLKLFIYLWTSLVLSAGGLFSTNSAGGWPRRWRDCTPLFVRFIDNILRPTSQARSCRAFGLWPSPTGPTVDGSRSPLGSPGFRTKSLRTCSGSLTPRVRCAARASATYRLAFPIKSQGRQPELGDFGAQ